MKLTNWIALAALAALIAGCDRNRDEPAPPEPTADASEATPDPAEEPGEAVSILRPEVEAEELPPEPLDPFALTIGFPGGGADLDEAAGEALQSLLTTEQMALGGPIILGAHSDSAGSDAVNMRAAQARGMAIAEWLIGQGVAADRIEVVVFGEQNPLEPNALPDGSPNEEGRAANRRVEITIAGGVAEASTSE